MTIELANPATPFHVLIVAAGQSTRMDGDIPKQYRMLGSKPVLRHSLETFLAIPGIKSLKVVIAEAHMNLYKDASSGLDVLEPVIGGSERNESVIKGLYSLKGYSGDEIILVHDAARPFVEPGHIINVVETVKRNGAASLACAVNDTVRRKTGEYVSREGLWSLQTPQGFKYGLLHQAHMESISSAGVTDDTMLVTALGHDVEMVPGSRLNIKITTQADWEFAERMIDLNSEIRTGSGFDVHAFATGKQGMIRLCGIDIPHTFGLEGHSDADVGLHAVTDALLGALALGDIGQHFPPSDMQWKDAASDRFLSHAVALVRERGGEIVNLDLTLICEAPKIGPHREAMQRRVAQICGIASDRVSIKATTTEKLGFTGRREGIAAQAVANIRVPRGE